MIGIITFHRAMNIGAVLQAFSLQEFVTEEIEPCELIDFYPNNIVIESRSLLRWILHFGKFVLTLPTSLQTWRKEKKFKTFINNRYHLSSNHYYGDTEISNNPPDYRVYISGSDQILNLTLSNYSVSYYLNFVKDNRKRISYASSFGREELSMQEYDAIEKYLPLFSSLSFRELSASNIVKRLIDKDSTVVLDPVFLHNMDYWSKIANDSDRRLEPYIFVYSMEATSGLVETVKIIHEEKGFPIITVIGGGKENDCFGVIDRSCGPEEFLSYIKNAEIVITNSFHGLAFSTIFRKKVYVVAHSKRNARIENFLTLIGDDDKLIPYNEKPRTVNCIYTDKAKKLLEEKIYISKRYLIDNLKK